MATDSTDVMVTAVTVRFDKALRRQIEDAAKSSVRTLSGEIVFRLRNSFRQQPDEAAA